MSDRYDVDDGSGALTATLVRSLDALPVPPGPAGLRSRSAVVGRFNPVTVLAILLIVLVAVLSTPAGRDAVGQAARWLQRLLAAPAWSAYYVDLAATDAAGLPGQRLMFSAGQFPGVATRPEVTSQALWIGWWSPDGDRFLVAGGSKLYVADTAGRVSEVADFGDLSIQETAWIGARTVAAVARQVNGRQWLVRVDLATRAVERRALPEGIEVQPTPTLQWAAFSPDGGWLVLEGAQRARCAAVRVYDLAADRIVDVIDGTTQRGFAIGWLADRQLVSAVCDEPTSTILLSVAVPGAPGTPIASMPWSPSNPPVVVDPPRARILLNSSRPGEPGAITAVALDGHSTELAHLAPLTSDRVFGRVFTGVVSREGRYLSFRVAEVHDGIQVSRGGLIDFATGEVLWACDTTCRLVAPR